MFTLKLRNSEWYRGKGGVPGPPGELVVSAPETPFDGMMCCLGVLFRDLGVDKEDMKYKGLPRSITTPCLDPLDEKGKDIYHRLIGIIVDSDTGEPVQEDSNYHCPKRRSLDEKIAGVNDHSFLTDKQRIEQLKPLFKLAGVEVEFLPDE